MDQTSQAKANEGETNGGDTDEAPASYALTTYDDDQQPVPLASVPPSSAAGGVAFVPLSASAYPATVLPPALSNPHEIAFQQLQAFWASQLAGAEQQEAAAGEAKKAHNHSLPLARIKKIMKADRDVKMIAAEAPAVFARACEMFILELTLRAWLYTEGGARRWTTLQRGDVVAAIHSTETYDFLTDIVPEEDRSSWSRGYGGGDDDDGRANRCAASAILFLLPGPGDCRPFCNVCQHAAACNVHVAAPAGASPPAEF